MNVFTQQDVGLGAAVTGDPAQYGFGVLRNEALRMDHRNHIHFQSTYPAREEPRTIPG